ncbi:MAG: hypothetical protein ACRDP2_09790, partial [Nocardioidaceae bacterium]
RPSTVAPAPPSAASAERRQPTPPASSKPDDFRSKLAEDWKTMKRGFATAPDDLRRIFDEAVRNFKGGSKAD